MQVHVVHVLLLYAHVGTRTVLYRWLSAKLASSSERIIAADFIIILPLIPTTTRQFLFFAAPMAEAGPHKILALPHGRAVLVGDSAYKTNLFGESSLYVVLEHELQRKYLKVFLPQRAVSYVIQYVNRNG